MQKFQYVLALYCIFWAIWSKAEFDKSKFSTKVLIILKYNQIKRVATNIDFLLVPSFGVIHSSQTAAFELSLKTPHYHHLCLLDDDDDDALDVDDNDDNNGGYVGYAMVISRFPTYI